MINMLTCPVTAQLIRTYGFSHDQFVPVAKQSIIARLKEHRRLIKWLAIIWFGGTALGGYIWGMWMFWPMIEAGKITLDIGTLIW